MAQPITVAIAFEYVVNPVKWTLWPAPNLDIRTVSDQGDWLVPSLVRGSARKADAWKARDEFFHLKHGDNNQLLDFLNRWGPWHPFEDFDPDVAVATKDVWQVREQFLKGVMNPIAEWLTDQSVNIAPLAVFQPRLEYPYFFFRATGCALAVHTTITLDLLRKVKFRHCARKDCRIPFEVTSKHGKRYCTQYCGHLESVRKGRREQQKLKRAMAKSAMASKRD